MEIRFITLMLFFCCLTTDLSQIPVLPFFVSYLFVSSFCVAKLYLTICILSCYSLTFQTAHSHLDHALTQTEVRKLDVITLILNCRSSYGWNSSVWPYLCELYSRYNIASWRSYGKRWADCIAKEDCTSQRLCKDKNLNSMLQVRKNNKRMYLNKKKIEITKMEVFGNFWLLESEESLHPQIWIYDIDAVT